MLAFFELELDGDVGVCSHMHDQVIGWNDKVPVHDDQFMANRDAGSPKDVRARDRTAVGVPGADEFGNVGGNAVPAASYRSGLRSGDGRVGVRDVVSHFGSLGGAVMPSVEARGGATTSGREAEPSVAVDGDF